MKKAFLFLLGLLFITAACVNVEEINDKLRDLEERLQKVETDLNLLSGTANGLSNAIKALQSNVFVDRVTPNDDGYVITFTDGTRATIYNGKNGKDGSNGKNGTDGKDGSTPNIGVATVEGQPGYFWTVNGELLKDKDGKNVSATSQVPEFKYEGGAWYYRFENGEWTKCSEGEEDEILVIEKGDSVIIKVGDTLITIPKENVSPVIESINPVITIGAKRLFVPVGQPVDLTEWFTVTPEDAVKTAVSYTFSNDAPFTINEAGVLNATGAGSYTVTIVADGNPEAQTSIVIRSAETPNSEEPERTINPENKLVLYEGSLAEYNTFEDFGGSVSFNPFNGAIAGVVNGTLNMRFAVPAKEDATLTRQNGHLHFMFYIDDIANVKPDNVELIELTNGTWDVKEIHWNNRIFSEMKSGWNEVDLAFKDATDEIGDPFDPTKPCFVRIVVPASGPDGSWAPFQFKDFFVYADNNDITAINPVITCGANRIFVPVGKSVDLKDWFTVVPESADKAKVQYTFSEGAPFTISDDGVLTATGEGSYTVNIISKDNEEIKGSIIVRTADAPGAGDEPERTIDPENKHFLYEGSLAEYNTFEDFGGSVSFNPFNGAIAGVVNGTLNMRFAVPSKTFSELTRQNGHLHFMFYVDDIANVHPDNVELIELTNGTWDKNEIHWNNSIFSSMKSGWNEVDLAFSEATDEIGDPFDPTKPCFVRIVVPASGPDGSWAPFQFKDFFVYAAATPLTVTEMLSLNNGDEFTAAECLVAGLTTKGFIATDGAKAVYVYTNSAPAVAVGDKVTFKGKKTTYNGVHEIETVTDLTVKSSGNTVTYPEAKDITAEVGTYTNTEAEFVSLTATLAKSGNYYNLNVEGETTKQGSIVYPAAYLDAASFDGKNIKVTGYYNGLSGSGGKYVNIVATKIEEAAAAPSITIDGDMSDWAGVKGYSGGESNTRIKEWKVASDENNLFFFFKVDKTKIKTSADNFDWGLYFYIGLDTDNNTATGANGGGGTSDGCEAQVCVFPWRGPNTEYTWVNGVDNNGWIKCPISGDSAGNPTVFGKVDGDYGFVEISVPKSAVGSLSSTIAVSCSMDWYATPREEVAL